MLEVARAKPSEGVDVVVGVIETHGREELEALLAGLEVIPRNSRTISHPMREFDVDAALKRCPRLIVVDELAHANVPSCRHPKRYLDVAELLNAGN